MTDTKPPRVIVTPAFGSPFELDWPDGWRIPIIGELLIIGPDKYYRVDGVQWELDQGDFGTCVQLRVVQG